MAPPPQPRSFRLAPPLAAVPHREVMLDNKDGPMVPRSTKPCERHPLGEDQAPSLRKPGIPLASLDLRSWPGGLEFAAPARTFGAAGHECEKDREELTDRDDAPVAYSAATTPTVVAQPATPVPFDEPLATPNVSLAEIIQAWPKLPGPIQTAITTIVRAAIDVPTG